MRVLYSQLADDMIRTADIIAAIDSQAGPIRTVYSQRGFFHTATHYPGMSKAQVLEVEVEKGNATVVQDLSRRVALVKNMQKDESARELARRHYQVETGMTHIIRFSGSADVQLQAAEPIKLLEVNTNTVPSGVLALGFDAVPSAGIHFPSVIIEVTPAEFDKIQAKELKLPQGWEIQEGELLRPVDTSRG